jgi:uncharacterized membrane protein (DUF485 family)
MERDTPHDWRAIAQSQEFERLVRERRRTAVGLGVLGLGWWALFILAVAFAPDILATAVGTDGLTLAYLLGLTQVPMTFAVLWLYVKRADGRLDQLERTAIAAAEGVR